MVNPVYQQDEELLLNPFGSKYLASGAYTDVNSNEFVVQEDTIISVLTGGDVSISENSIDYKASMNLSGVTLKKGALIVAPVGEAFKSITIDSGSIMAYNCVVKGEKPGSFVGLLDLYPDASAAYSLRKLRADYEGSAIQVRIDTATSPQPSYNIGFDSNGNLDTADLLSKAAGNDAFIHTWYDQSGQGNNVTQVEASKQPKIVNSGVVELKNGKPTINKDGLLKGFNGSALSLYNSYGFSNFSVATNNEVSVGGILISTANLNTQGFIIFSDTRTPQERNVGIQQSPTVVADLSKQYFAGDQVLLSSFCDLSGNLSAFDNNNVGGTTNIPSINFINNTFNVGYNPSGNTNFNGSFQEVIIYPSDQSANRTAIETNINDYYTIY